MDMDHKNSSCMAGFLWSVPINTCKHTCVSLCLKKKHDLKCNKVI